MSIRYCAEQGRGELPAEQPIKLDLVVNLATAKAIGRSIPAPLLSVADAVIH
jgi:putative ABC transport system substrate-binding protein